MSLLRKVLSERLKQTLLSLPPFCKPLNGERNDKTRGREDSLLYL